MLFLLLLLRSTAVSRLCIVGGTMYKVAVIAYTLAHCWGSPSFRKGCLCLMNVSLITVFEKQTDADPATLCTAFEAFKGLTSKTCPILIISSWYMRDKVISLLPGSKGTAGSDRSSFVDNRSGCLGITLENFMPVLRPTVLSVSVRKFLHSVWPYWTLSHCLLTTPAGASH